MGNFNQSIKQFLNQASSSSPTPGGGSIAAISAALGASMGAMVANLTTGKKFVAVEEKMQHFVGTMDKAIIDFETFVQEDMDAFEQYMQALGLPKTSDVEKQTRLQAMQQAAVNAATVPMRLMQKSLETIQAIADIRTEVNKNIISDLGIAIIQLEGAIQSAWITVEINLSTIKDAEKKTSFQKNGIEILVQAEQLKTEVLKTVRQVIHEN